MITNVMQKTFVFPLNKWKQTKTVMYIGFSFKLIIWTWRHNIKYWWLTSVPFFIGIFRRELIEFLRTAHVLSTMDSWCYNMTALSKSKSVPKCRSYSSVYPFFIGILKRIYRIFKTFSYCIHYRFLMLYRILLNLCIWQEGILHNMTALSESKSFKNVGVITARTFFHRYFVRELIGFSRLAHIVSIIDTWCFIGSFLTFAFDRGHTAQHDYFVKIKIGSKM